MSHSVFRSSLRSSLLASVVAVAVLAIGSPALAKKKKAGDADGADASTQPGLPSSGKAADGASQANDQERPKPILDEGAAGPDADEQGNVSFAGSRVGKGKITVKAPPADKAKVYLEGRYFGIAPRTINKIPPGDYIIEITYPSGQSVTKSVSVIGEEESIVELGGAAEIVAPQDKPMSAEKAAKRWRIAQIVGIASLATLVVGGGLGVWEYTVQRDYNSTPGDTVASREHANSLADKGDKLALAANICYVAGAVGLVAAAVIGYPAYKARKGEQRTESPDSPAPLSFIFLPGPTLGSATAGMVYTF
jgi:hypothetical protein